MSSSTWSSTTASRTRSASCPRSCRVSSTIRRRDRAPRCPAGRPRRGGVIRAAAGRSPAALHFSSNQERQAPVISPRLDHPLEQVDSNYASVIVAAKRARQINSYYHNLGEGTFDEFPPPMIESGSKNYLTIALEEVAAGKLK